MLNPPLTRSPPQKVKVGPIRTHHRTLMTERSMPTPKGIYGKRAHGWAFWWTWKINVDTWACRGWFGKNLWITWDDVAGWAWYLKHSQILHWSGRLEMKMQSEVPSPFSGNCERIHNTLPESLSYCNNNGVWTFWLAVKNHHVSSIADIIYFPALKMSKIGLNLANRYPAFAWMEIEVKFTLPTTQKEKRTEHA